MARYHLQDRPGKGIAVISRRDHRGVDTAMWSRARSKKPHTCVVTGREIAVGDEAYSPTGNKQYRYERIAALVIEPELAEHRLSVRKHRLGGSPVRGYGPIYGTMARCSCGWLSQINEGPPSRGGAKEAKRRHEVHLDEFRQVLRTDPKLS